MQDPGSESAAVPALYASGESPWPTLMPPISVPVLLLIRLLAICRLCPHAWSQIPPPPWELLLMVKPSMLEGLHWKLLGNGSGFKPHLAGLRTVVPVGKAASPAVPVP